ncbi:MAG TPA: tRNA pseudouridine(38-40) synthase TruA [Bacillales bacterium]|nr:tRNA pseudouridine(38-40) synthase TruA [Bacillales bacterium]
MSRLKCEVSYDGTEFSGWQVQPNGRTVQGVIEAALQDIHKGRQVRISASGRTDAGVHARAQIFHFDSELKIPEEGWRKALNGLLPDDVVIQKVQKVSSAFHARFDVAKKEYRYRLLPTSDFDIFRRRYIHHFPYQLDQASVCEAAKFLVGEHDFTSFCAANTDVKNKVRTLETLDIHYEGDELVFRLVGNGFLYQMVRIIVGTLIEVGRGKRSAVDVSRVLAERDRTQAGPTAPGKGLVLWEVTYDSNDGMG